MQKLHTVQHPTTLPPNRTSDDYRACLHADEEGRGATRRRDPGRADLQERAVGGRGDRGAAGADDRGRPRGPHRAPQLRRVRGQEDEGEAEGAQPEDERDRLHPCSPQDPLQAEQADARGAPEAPRPPRLRRPRGQRRRQTLAGGAEAGAGPPPQRGLTPRGPTPQPVQGVASEAGLHWGPASSVARPVPDPQPRIAAVHYGTRRVGLAVTDPLRLFARPLGTFPPDEAVAQLVALHAREGLEAVVVGWPLTEAGEEGKATRRVAPFL